MKFTDDEQAKAWLENDALTEADRERIARVLRGEPSETPAERANARRRAGRDDWFAILDEAFEIDDTFVSATIETETPAARANARRREFREEWSKTVDAAFEIDDSFTSSTIEAEAVEPSAESVVAKAKARRRAFRDEWNALIDQAFEVDDSFLSSTVEKEVGPFVLNLTGPKQGGPTLVDLMALSKRLTGRDPTPAEIEKAKLALASRDREIPNIDEDPDDADWLKHGSNDRTIVDAEGNIVGFDIPNLDAENSDWIKRRHRRLHKQTIQGREALVAYLDANRKAVAPEDATHAIIRFVDDGGMLYVKMADKEARRLEIRRRAIERDSGVIRLDGEVEMPETFPVPAVRTNGHAVKAKERDVAEIRARGDEVEDAGEFTDPGPKLGLHQRTINGRKALVAYLSSAGADAKIVAPRDARFIIINFEDGEIVYAHPKLDKLHEETIEGQSALVAYLDSMGPDARPVAPEDAEVVIARLENGKMIYARRPRKPEPEDN